VLSVAIGIRRGAVDQRHRSGGRTRARRPDARRGEAA
jgi:hypothetical protein